jgi:hypothetical protein
MFFPDPGPGSGFFSIPDPRVKKAPDPDPQHWISFGHGIHFMGFAWL